MCEHMLPTLSTEICQCKLQRRGLHTAHFTGNNQEWALMHSYIQYLKDEKKNTAMPGPKIVDITVMHNYKCSIVKLSEDA